MRRQRVRGGRSLDRDRRPRRGRVSFEAHRRMRARGDHVHQSRGRRTRRRGAQGARGETHPAESAAQRWSPS